MRIRRARERDYIWILPQLQAFDSFADLKQSLLSADSQTAFNRFCLLVREHIFLVSHKPDGTPTGFIAGAVVPHILNPEIHACHELLWWVIPEFRGTSAAQILLDSFIETARTECDLLLFSLNRKTPISKRNLRRRGFKEFETVFLMEVS